MDRSKNFTLVYYTYFIYGFMSMLINTVLPYLSSDYNLIYSQSGLLISLLSIGNFSASIVGGMMINKFGRKKSVIFLSTFLVLAPLGIILSSLHVWVFICGFFLGLGLGSINYFDNLIVNDQAPGEGKYLSLLHTFYAVGAFLTPLFTLAILKLSGSWRTVVFITIFISLSAVVAFLFVPIVENPKIFSKDVVEKKEEEIPYYKNPVYYIILAIFFLYVGGEQTINGWLVTYLTDSNIVSDTVAQAILSVFWVLIIIGRIIASKLTNKVKKSSIILTCSILITLTFSVFLFTKNPVVAATAILLLGFFSSPVYPLSLATGGSIIHGSPQALTILMVFAGLGATLVPYILGKVSDNIGILGGMITILVSFTLLTVAAFLLKFIHKKETLN